MKIHFFEQTETGRKYCGSFTLKIVMAVSEKAPVWIFFTS